MFQTQPSVWIAGDWRRGEFAGAMEWLKQAARCVWLDDGIVAEDQRAPRDVALSPAAILLVQSRPGQVGVRVIERLHAAAPLARIIALVGAWCEGEQRSGQPAAGVVRVPVTSWKARLPNELGLAADSTFARRLPRTATTTDRLEAELRTAPLPTGTDEPGELAVVYSTSKANSNAIRDMLRTLGINAVWQSTHQASSEAIDLVVLDGWEAMSTYDQSRRAGEETEEPPASLLLLHFPRTDDFTRAKQAGIRAVLTLPLEWTELAATIAKIAPRATPGSADSSV